MLTLDILMIFIASMGVAVVPLTLYYVYKLTRWATRGTQYALQASYKLVTS